jgi:hypothetical protein
MNIRFLSHFLSHLQSWGAPIKVKHIALLKSQWEHHMTQKNNLLSNKPYEFLLCKRQEKEDKLNTTTRISTYLGFEICIGSIFV